MLPKEPLDTVRRTRLCHAADRANFALPCHSPLNSQADRWECRLPDKEDRRGGYSAVSQDRPHIEGGGEGLFRLAGGARKLAEDSQSELFAVGRTRGTVRTCAGERPGRAVMGRLRCCMCGDRRLGNPTSYLKAAGLVPSDAAGSPGRAGSGR